LFVCWGNACRSQMAEAFAKHFGGDVMEVQSAGMMPLAQVPAQTRKVMAEKSVPTDGQFPKGVEVYQNEKFDLVINMSGTILPRGLKDVERVWEVKDPYGAGDDSYRETRDELADRIADLIADIRANNGEVPPPKPKKRGFFPWSKS